MLMPKRVKYRKQMRGRMKGKATRGTDVVFGEYGLQALEPAWITARQIDALLWSCGQRPEMKAHPRHRTRTTFY